MSQLKLAIKVVQRIKQFYLEIKTYLAKSTALNHIIKLIKKLLYV